MARKQFKPLSKTLVKQQMLKLREDVEARMHMVGYVHVIDSALYLIAQYRRENKTLLKQINNIKLPMIDLKSLPLSMSNDQPGLIKILVMQQETVERIKDESNERIELLEDQVIGLQDRYDTVRIEYTELESKKAEDLSNKHAALIEKFNEANKAAGIMMEQNRELKKENYYQDGLLDNLKQLIEDAHLVIHPKEMEQAFIKKHKLPKLFLEVLNVRDRVMSVKAQVAIIDMAYSLKHKFPKRIMQSHYNHLPSKALSWLHEKDWAYMISDAETMKQIRDLYHYFDIEFADATINVLENLNLYVKDEMHLLLEQDPKALSSRTTQVISSWVGNKPKMVKELLGLSRKDWLMYRNCGAGTVREITKFYRYLGIKYRQE